MNVSRLFRMGLPEVVDRSRQELWKGFERIGLAEITPTSPIGVFGELAAGPELDAIRTRAQAGDLKGAASALFERFRAAAPDRFFAGASRPVTPGLLDRAAHRGRPRCSPRRTRSARGGSTCSATAALASATRSTGTSIPVSRPPGPARALEPHRPARRPDASATRKVIWELNRHQWLVPLGQAYR